jgi:hypothetical protein
MQQLQTTIRISESGLQGPGDEGNLIKSLYSIVVYNATTTTVLYIILIFFLTFPSNAPIFFEGDDPFLLVNYF